MHDARSIRMERRRGPQPPAARSRSAGLATNGWDASAPLTCRQYLPGTIGACEFDATITIGAQRLETAGLANRCDEAAAAVRQAVERMDGANWIDVMATAISIPRRYPMSVVYPRGRCLTPDTEEWRELQRTVEAVAAAALVAAGAPF